MQLHKSVGSAVSGYWDAVVETLEQSVRELLETKHLYQSVVVETSEIGKKFLARVDSPVRAQVQNHLIDARFSPWVVRDLDNWHSVLALLAKGNEKHVVPWTAPDAKLYCKTCARLEPFNSVSASSLFNRINPASGGFFRDAAYVQVFSLTYLCQSCKSIPEAFLVSRSGTRLTLTGRSPIEHVEVPKAIAKEVAKYFSDATVAYQSGQTLAALFLLRTLCEQWARRFADRGDKADVAIEKYMASLPDDFKSRFPSLRDLYSDLSAALHEANANDALFAVVHRALEEHFSARLLFKL
jgi:hypothetical protein